MAGSNYSFTENGQVIPFEDAFIRVEQFQNQLYLWGNNNHGQVGDNTTAARSTPRQEFTSSTNWKQVACGAEYTAAIKTDGTLWLWGRNNFGQLGINDLVSRSTPVQEFTSSANWKLVGCGENHTGAIKTDGTLWMWGYNNEGQIGDNTGGIAADRSTPRQEFTSSTNWKQVGGGRGFTMALKTDGTIWGWGNNARIGINLSSQNSSTPRQEFTSSTNWKQISSGYRHNAAIKIDGTLWVWGVNSNVQLGLNDTTERLTPVQEFTSSTNWKQVGVGDFHTTAIKTDGTLWVWGTNSSYQLGLADTIDRSTPVQEFTSSTNWKQVSSGRLHTAAIKTDGTLWAWGNNTNGQIGSNNNTVASTPRQEFTSSTNWKQVRLGQTFTAAIKAEDYPILY